MGVLSFPFTLCVINSPHLDTILLLGFLRKSFPRHRHQKGSIFYLNILLSNKTGQNLLFPYSIFKTGHSLTGEIPVRASLPNYSKAFIRHTAPTENTIQVLLTESLSK